MDTTLSVASMDYFHLYLFVKALRTPGLSINSQNCMGIVRSESERNEKLYLYKCASYSPTVARIKKMSLLCKAFY